MATRRRTVCPRPGTKFMSQINPAAAMFYESPNNGKPYFYGNRVGVAVLTNLGSGRQRTCLPGPRGGLVYLRYADGSYEGIFRNDLIKVSKHTPLSGYKRRGRKKRSR